MARIVSFVVLVVILLLFVGLFFQVMADFLLPMFLAVLLVIIFAPVHRWFKTRCGKHDRLAAMLTTCTILLAFFLPASFILLRAAQEGGTLYRRVVHREHAAREGEAPAEPSGDSKSTAPPAARQEPRPPADEQSARQAAAENEQPSAEEEKAAENSRKGVRWFAAKITEYGGMVGLKIDDKDIESRLHAKLEQYLTPMALSTGHFLLKFVFGVFVMVVSLYYFLADGPAMIMALMRLLPLDDQYEAQLIDQFANVTRAVVLATLLSALAQGVLAGIGFYFAGASSVFLLTVLAMLFAIIPFIGSAGVWVPVCLWIAFVDDRLWPGIFLAVYCGVVVSCVDNVIKPLVLHGRSNIHPLLALLSVLGGVQALGPIGIIVGPMAVAFLQTLLEMINKEMVALGKEKVVVAKSTA
jgi:predicted PurR-regulated permease PerM